MTDRRRNRGARANGHAEAVSVPPSHRAIDESFLDRTIEIFQTRTDRPLTREDAREMIENVTGFFRILGEWNQAEQESRDSDPAEE
ncbi:hypothetical protein [Nitratireductor sp. XY-223]|uniref:hypothetical protein n=1 Tax=Nitratireductor sp. XY-223 TaxID=2561926 RepID=UPI0010A9E25C|nr:hypothetical protein [Nitratireductor sp. XY-223]